MNVVSRGLAQMKFLDWTVSSSKMAERDGGGLETCTVYSRIAVNFSAIPLINWNSAQI
jgi:hypothetical protein